MPLPRPARRPSLYAAILSAGLLAACVGGNGSASLNTPTPPPVVNTMAVTVDSGPAGATGAINHAYVTVRVCAHGSTTQCASIDHVLLDTGSWGLRLVRSVLAAGAVTLAAETDAHGNTIEECETFGGGQTWGPVGLADITLAGEVAAKLPVQVMDDSTTPMPPPPATCGANGTLINGVGGFGANGVLGVGVFAQDCGAACAPPAPGGTYSGPPVYYGCTSAGTCTAEGVALVDQVTNPVAGFTADNNGVIIAMANLINANGDTSVQGELTFGLGTQSDNPLPATGLTVLGANGSGDFTATYNGSTTVLQALIDSGTDSYVFNDPSIAVCSTGSFVGYYCPATAPLSAFAVNIGAGANNATNQVNFAIADPSSSFEASLKAGAAAFEELGGGPGAAHFVWGMPFFYGRKIYIGIDQKAAGAYTGPFYAY